MDWSPTVEFNLAILKAWLEIRYWADVFKSSSGFKNVYSSFLRGVINYSIGLKEG